MQVLTAIAAVLIFPSCIAINQYLTHYCVVRSDIPFGAQAAQLIHAAGQSVTERVSEGTYAIALHVKDETELYRLTAKLELAGIKHTLIRESDAPYAGQIMAIGIPPQDRAKLKPFLSSYPLVKYNAPLAQSDRAPGVMTQGVGGLNPSGRATSTCSPFQRIRRWLGGKNSPAAPPTQGERTTVRGR